MAQLHNKNIMYRDLKPENVLLDIDGHVVLGDFGHTKMGMEAKAFATTVCGSAEYMSPEMLAANGYTRAVDYYSFGVLAYELLVGQPPFQSEDQDQLVEMICNSSPQFPDYVSDSAKELIRALLKKDPSTRLGYQGGFESIKQHNWFKAVNWVKAEMRMSSPPYLPDLRENIGEACVKTSDSDALMFMEEFFESFDFERQVRKGRNKNARASSSAGSLCRLRLTILA